MFGKKNIRWYKVFSSAAKATEVLPLNKPVKVDMDGGILCLIRTDKGFYAFEELCPHAKAPLIDSWADENNCLVCPYHRYKFDLDTGFEKTCGGNALKRYPIEIRDDGLFIGKESKGWF